MSRILVFAGPTVTREQILTLVPESEVLPPVAAGDLLQLMLQPGDLVALIDGFFYQSASVQHKEILDLLYRGVHVWGASSMGALRAAELAPFGMRGFGQIFKAYLHGKIEGDDEVAVLHAPKDMGYASLAEALVNIRYACECAVAEGIISPYVQQRVVEIAASMPFYERSYPEIFKQAVVAGLSLHDIDALQSFVRSRQPNLKHQDALELLRALRNPPLEPLKASFEWYETAYIHRWRINVQGMCFNDTEWIAATDVLMACQLFYPDYPSIHSRLLLQMLTTMAARSRNMEIRSGEICFDLIAQYIAARSGFSLQETFPICIDKWIRPEERRLSREEQLARIAVRLWHAPCGFDWRDVLIPYLRKTGLFDCFVKVVAEARALNEKLWGLEAVIRYMTLPADVVHTWFSRRWGVAEADLEIAAMDRGFKDLADFTRKARFFYMADKYIGAAC